MLIATRFKRPKAPITIGDKTYFFTPREPGNPDSEHVCDVQDKGHAQRLLGIPEGYYLPDDEPAPATTAPRPQATVVAASREQTTGGDGDDPSEKGEGGGTGDGSVQLVELDEDQREAAKNLNALSWQALKAQITKGGIPKVVLVEALRLEEAKPEDDQRSTTVKILKQAIEAG